MARNAHGEAASAADDLAVSADQFWTLDFGSPPRIPHVGDADGDGRADLLSLWPRGGCVIDVSLTSPLGKPVLDTPGFGGFGQDALAVTVGEFADRNTAEVLAIFADGSVRVAWGAQRSGSIYTHNDEAARVTIDKLPKQPLVAVAGDFTTDGRTDACLVGADGALVVLENVRTGAGPPRLVPRFVQGSLGDVRRIAAGRLGNDKSASLVWLNDAGEVYRAGLEFGSDGSTRVTTPRRLVGASPGARLAVGRFLNRAGADVIVGAHLLPAGDPARGFDVPALAETATKLDDVGWLAGDFDGNGQDDLLLKRQLERRVCARGEVWDRFQWRIHYFSHRDDQRHGYISSTQDGLLDDWKLGRVKPGGLDLPSLGCSPGHRDLIVEIGRFDDFSLDEVKQNMELARQFYAALPIGNPDGTRGIALHCIYADPTPLTERDSVIRELGRHLPRPELRGVVHGAICDKEGGGLWTVGGCGGVTHYNGDWKVLTHELGHQLNLRHDGYWQSDYCAIYPSLMNYAYSYGIEGVTASMHYSDGRFASFVIDERKLSERLPFSFAEVEFLHKHPYTFPLRRGPNNTTLVDWNRNGKFGEEAVRADVNYSHGTDLGKRVDLGVAHTAPAVVAHGECEPARLLVFYGRAGDANAHGVDLSHERRGGLYLRIWNGADVDAENGNWSREITIEATDLSGDPTAAYVNGATWLAYATPSGAVVRRITFDALGGPYIEGPTIVPETANAQPTLASWHRHLALLLWRSPHEPVGLRLLSVEDAKLSIDDEDRLPIHSLAAVAAVPGADDPKHPSLWIARLEGQLPDRPHHTEVLRYVPEGHRRYRVAQRHWIGGLFWDGSHLQPFEKHAAQRMALAWEPEHGLGPQGRLYHFCGAETTAERPWSEQYVAMQVADRTFGGGWMTRRYLEPDFTSRSAPDVCWFRGDLVYCLRQHSDDPQTDDHLTLSFHGAGIQSDLMSDFNDIDWICRIGLSHALPGVVEVAPR